MLTALVHARVFLAAGPTDMRKSFDSLSGLVRGRLGGNPLSGDLFVFCNAHKNRLKILFFDTTGLWVLAKRLERGTFAWPGAKDSTARIEMRYEQLLLLLNGLRHGRAARACALAPTVPVAATRTSHLKSR